MANHFITRITTDLIEEIKQSLKRIRGWGSVEIYVQDGRVTQITERNIKKTNHDLKTTNDSRTKK